jgi:acetoin utilization deacetylase AcuC-like enzyme
VKAFYSDTFVLPLPEHHRFPMAKYRLLRERLVEQRVLDARDLHVPEPASWDELRLVHDPGYVDAVANGTLSADAQRRIGFPWSPMMVERSRRSVGATIAAAREVAAGSAKVAANLAGGTHHAFRDRGEGYCVFNDVAVAARVLLRDHAVARVAVVGDTPLDLAAGKNAGAGWVIGVMSGAHGVETLGKTPHTHLLGSVAELPGLFGP